jgi:hypothetical protein
VPEKLTELFQRPLLTVVLFGCAEAGAADTATGGTSASDGEPATVVDAPPELCRAIQGIAESADTTTSQAGEDGFELKARLYDRVEPLLPPPYQPDLAALALYYRSQVGRPGRGAVSPAAFDEHAAHVGAYIEPRCGADFMSNYLD